ncbi:MAG: DUF7619 domain-containing protein [Flammeovirgaceae bacterium]
MKTRFGLSFLQLISFCLMIGMAYQLKGQDQWQGWALSGSHSILNSNYLTHDNKFDAIGAGGNVNMGQKADGTFVLWGAPESYFDFGPSEEELKEVISFDVGLHIMIGLKADSTVLAWGADVFNQHIIASTLTEVVAIAAGSEHLVVAKADSTVFAWGRNHFGETEPPAGLTGVVAVAAGNSHSVALKADGTVVAWGSNRRGQLNIPAGLTDVIDIKAAGYHTLALKSDGTVVAWGANDVHTNRGQINVPAGLTDVVAISAGFWHSVALKSDSTVVSWGSHGNQALVPQPAGLSQVKAIDAGIEHTTALLEDGTIVSWGLNNYGETVVPQGIKIVKSIAVGSEHVVLLKKDRTLVTWGRRISPIPDNLPAVQAVVAGYRHTVALLENGRVEAWGINDKQQVEVPFGLSDVVAVAAGAVHSVALKSDGTVVAWGGEHGQSDVPNDLPAVKAIGAGRIFTVVVLEDGTVRGWGGGASSPANHIPLGLNQVKTVVAGRSHISVLKEDGTVLSWETNGQVAAPNDLTNVVQITASDHRSLALKADGTIETFFGGGAIPSDLAPMKGIAAGGVHVAFAWGGLVPVITSSCPLPTNKEAIPITIEFSDTVSSIQVSDFVTENCQITNLESTDQVIYQAVLIPNHNNFDPTTLSVYLKDSVTVDQTGLSNVRSNRFQIEHWPNANRISGRVYRDLNQNCQFDDAVNSPLSDFIIKASPSNYFTNTDEAGNYSFLVPSGDYTLELIVPEVRGLLFEQSCEITHQVSLDSVRETIDQLDFAINVTECPILSVKVASNRRRRCFENQTIITYKNEGFASVPNAKIHLELPEYVDFIGSTVSATVTDEGIYEFNVGELASGAFGTISVIDSVRCEMGIFGLDQCTKVWITPSNACLANITATSSAWDSSSIAIEGYCMDTLQGPYFIIRNVGEGDMDAASIYRIYEGINLASSDSFQLASGDSLVIQYSPFATNLRLEADQLAGHPGNSRPQATIIGCATNASSHFSTAAYFLQDDADLEIDIDCLPIIDSYDPNDKLATPSGITENRYVEPNAPLEYRIRFQNTGTDTAYTVVIIDTLSAALDVSTLQMGSVSHDYELAISGQGQPVLTWTFNDIDLVDSLTDEPNSHGFIKFSISPLADLPNGTIVHNFADIYFDFNLPIRTNDAWINYYDTTIVTSGYEFGEDLTLPIPSIEDVDAYVNAPFRAQIHINEAIDLTLDAIAVTNATLSDLQGSGTDYSVLVSPIAEGIVVLGIAEGVFTDEAGNRNLASNSIFTTFDQTGATATLSSDVGFSNEPFTVTFQFTEAVRFSMQDIAVTNASISDFQGSQDTYTVLVSPIAEGEVTISIAETDVLDMAGNPTSAATIEVIYDITPPVAQWDIPSDPTAPVGVSFNEAVIGELTIDDFEVTGTALVDVQQEGNQYQLTFELIAGVSSVNLKAGAVTDRAGNPNGANQQEVVTSIVHEKLAALTVIAPNPAKSHLQIELPWAKSGEKVIQVTDLLGKVMETKIIHDNQYLLNVSSWATGAYLLRIQTPQGVVTKVFVKE